MMLLPVLGFVFLLGGEPQTLRLTDFGAVPDDGADDAPALRVALQNAAACGNAVLIIPPGEYDLDSRVNIAESFRYLRIEGRGHNISRLIGRNGEGVLRIHCSNPDAVLEIADVDIVPARPAAGTGLELLKPYTEPSGEAVSLLLSGLEMRANDRTADYFDRWIVAEGWTPLVENVMNCNP